MCAVVLDALVLRDDSLGIVATLAREMHYIRQIVISAVYIHNVCTYT